jgi:hypothetical protein
VHAQRVPPAKLQLNMDRVQTEMLHPLDLETTKTARQSSWHGLTPSNVMDDALKQVSDSSADMLPNITAVCRWVKSV